MIGQILKGYRLTEKIKTGSVGTVWKASNTSGQVFAIKQLSEKHTAIPRKVKRFYHECALTMKLEHPGIIKVIEYVEDTRFPFFVMEYFESENLKVAMLTLPEWVSGNEFTILRQTAEALAYIHSKGIIHKDVKPENVLVSPRAEVRLIDFSLGETKMDRMLQFGRRIEGSPLYMAPEQVQGHTCDSRTDIYSFGATMFELLTKQPPFLAPDLKALFEKHVREAPPALATFVKSISPDIEALCARMLAKKREDRFQDLTTVIHELRKWEKKDTRVRLRQVEPAKPRMPEGAGR